MLGWLIYSEKDARENVSYIEWFIAEAAKQQMNVKLMYREHLIVGLKENKHIITYYHKHIPLPDFVVIRTIEPLLQYTFEALSIPTFNSFTVAQMANHKSWTYIKMSELNIPLLQTIFTTKQTMPKEPPLSFPFVVKEATGRGGKQVYYIEDDYDWQNIKQLIESNDLIIQEANVQLGKDVRVFVIGKSIIAAVLRENKHDFRANFKLGGTARLYSLSTTERDMIQTIINHFDFDLVGIDFLINDKNELIFNEIEDVVGSRILSETTNFNLLEKYMLHIKRFLDC